MKNLFCSKRAVLEVQFNWIFILIAGGVFLFLFLSVVNSQKKEADQLVNAELLSKLDSLIAGSASSFQSVKVVSLPQVTLDVVCDENGYSALRIGSGFERRTPVQAIYARPTLSTKKLTIFTDEYSVGFDVAPVLYLKGSGTSYFILNDTAYLAPQKKMVADIYDAFPENVTTVIKADAASFAAALKSSDDPVFICTDLSATSRPCHVAALGFAPSGTIIDIMPDSTADVARSGTLDFCAQGLCDRTTYASMPMLKGAVIAADNTSYICTSGKILERQSILVNLALNRTLIYLRSPDLARDCAITYNNINASLNALKAAGDLSKTGTIAQGSKQLALSNADLSRGTRCPLLY